MTNASCITQATNPVADSLPCQVIDVDISDSEDGVLQTVLSISRQTAENESLARQDSDQPIVLW